MVVNCPSNYKAKKGEDQEGIRRPAFGSPSNVEHTNAWIRFVNRKDWKKSKHSGI